jgi:hypothetical protein
MVLLCYLCTPLTLFYQCDTEVVRKVWGGQMAYGLVLESLVIFVMRLHWSKACLTRTMPPAAWVLRIFYGDGDGLEQKSKA